MSDSVNHPQHYNKGAIETIQFVDQVCAHYFGDEAFSVGNALRYLARAPHKSNKLEDLRKAVWYLNHAVATLETKEKAYIEERRQENEAFTVPTLIPMPNKKGRKKGRGR